MKQFHLALIETASNQRYIFQSNKLREVLGASELVRRAGTDFVRDAVAEGGFEGACEVCVATSGKAVAAFEAAQDARTFVSRVTRRALAEAPGLGVYGAVSEALSADADPATAAAALRGLFERIGRNRLALAAPETRFGHLPPVAPCRTTGLPGAGWWIDPDGKSAEISAAALAKRAAAREDRRNGVTHGPFAADRLREDFGDAAVCADPDLLEKTGCGWFAVVHADGNGFGEVFMNLDRCLPAGRPRTAQALLAFYADLSAALDDIGRQATVEAVGGLCDRRVRDPARDDPRRAIPIVPLVMGGDDLTVIVDGSQAVAFAAAYVAAFERRSGEHPLVGTLTRNGRPLSFGAAAGVAIVKPHHPFHRAYELSEELLRSAKIVKKVLGAGASALDFQVVFGDTTSDLETLRDGWRIGNASLTLRPYVVSPPARYADAAAESRAWADRRHVDTLAAARAGLAARVVRDGEERMALPRTQQHVLRDALFDGAPAAEARLGLIAHRYPGVDFGVFGEKPSLFLADAGGWPAGRETAAVATRLLDAMEMNDVCGEPAEATTEAAA